MNKTGWRILMMLGGVALLQGCVAYPVIDEPYYGGRDRDGPGYRHSRPVIEVHERGPRYMPAPPPARHEAPGHFSPPPQARPREPERRQPAPQREREHERDREREPVRGRWDGGYSRR